MNIENYWFLGFLLLQKVKLVMLICGCKNSISTGRVFILFLVSNAKCDYVIHPNIHLIEICSD